MEDWDAWIRIFRDVAVAVVGIFMLVYETVFAPNPNVELIGAGLALLGLPPALRLDLRTSSERRKSRRKDDET